MKKLIKKILKEENFDWVEGMMEPEEFETIKDDKHRYDIIMDTISKVKRYGDWKISIDEMGGTVEWYGNGRWSGFATPEWTNPFEIPVDAVDGGFGGIDDYYNVKVIKTPEFKYVLEVVDWYQNTYFEKVNEILLKWKAEHPG